MGKKIVVIEDDTFISSILIGELIKAGYDVKGAQSGKTGIELVKTENPDLVLVDLLMPEVDGYHVLEALKADASTAHIPAIVLSNYGQPQEIARAKELGALDFLIKVNFTPKDIIEKIGTLLASSTPR